MKEPCIFESPQCAMHFANGNEAGSKKQLSLSFVCVMLSLTNVSERMRVYYLFKERINQRFLSVFRHRQPQFSPILPRFFSNPLPVPLIFPFEESYFPRMRLFYPLWQCN